MSIKVGDWVAFQVGDEDRDFVAPKRCAVWLPKKHATPIPPPDPHAVLKEEVVQAAIFLVKGAALFGYDLPARKKAAVDAVSALLAAQRPPSKYAGLRKALDASYDPVFPHALDQVRAQLDKLEAEERGHG